MPITPRIICEPRWRHNPPGRSVNQHQEVKLSNGIIRLPVVTFFPLENWICENIRRSMNRPVHKGFNYSSLFENEWDELPIRSVGSYIRKPLVFFENRIQQNSSFNLSSFVKAHWIRDISSFLLSRVISFLGN